MGNSAWTRRWGSGVRGHSGGASPRGSEGCNAAGREVPRFAVVGKARVAGSECGTAALRWLAGERRARLDDRCGVRGLRATRRTCARSRALRVARLGRPVRVAQCGSGGLEGASVATACGAGQGRSVATVALAPAPRGGIPVRVPRVGRVYLTHYDVRRSPAGDTYCF